jgi:hypothetical protein
VGVVLLLAILGNLQPHRLGRSDPVRVVIADDKFLRVARLSRHGNVAVRYPSIAQGLLSLRLRLALSIRRAGSATPNEHENACGDRHNAHHP